MSKPLLFCISFTRWKHGFIKAFLQKEGEVIFVSSAKDAVNKGFNQLSILITWASKDESEVKKLVDKYDIKVWRMEDGFIRSTGLGSDLTVPASLVLDKTGIYYDPTQRSDLEELLQNHIFSDLEIKRAERLRLSILDNEISKYNLGGKFSKEQLNNKEGQKIILVPGQVEADASIKKGCIDIATDSELLHEVRKKEPDAYIVYKPHPDVVSGNRKRSVVDKCGTYDQLVKHASITDCLAMADELHTMTSLVGFEGLLRGSRVVCYGRPFYSGWGLTKDRHKSSNRRNRELLLDELVYASLVLYPLYIDRVRHLTTPEEIIEQLTQQIKEQGGKKQVQLTYIGRVVYKLLNILRSCQKYKE